MIAKLNKKERTKILHVQLMTYFRERILDGRLPAGTRLPNDGELAAQYQISRDTVRQALALLVNEGLIERVQGRGTFVSQPPLNGSPVPQLERKQIGLVLNRTSTTQLNMNLLVGVEQAAKSHGYSVSFTYAEGDQEQQTRDIARLRANHVLGMIIYPTGDVTHDASIQQLQADHVPFVLMDRYFPGLAADYVGLDNVGGGYRATEHLLILGHRRIGFVFSHEETLRTTSVHERWQGYCKALQKYEIPYDETLVVPDFRQLQMDTHEGLVEFLKRPDRPSGIFAVNDYVAMDVMQAAKAIHLRIPEDLAVGLPVVSTAVSGIPEMITDGVTGRLVPPDRADLLADVLAELLVDAEQRARLGEAGRRQVCEHASWPTAIQPLHALLEHQTSGAGRAAATAPR